jgi:hypothetical protein
VLGGFIMHTIKNIFIFFLLLLPFEGFSLEKNIPSDTNYIGIKVDNNIHSLLSHLLTENYKNMIYPKENEDTSIFSNLITSLKKEKTDYIELFFSKRWGVLVKVKVNNFDKIIKVFTNVLQEEGFFPKITQNTGKMITIESQSPGFQGSHILMLKDKDHNLVISNTKEALDAWNSRNTPLQYYTQISDLLNKNKKNSILFAYNNLSTDTQKDPYFMVFSRQYPQNNKIIKVDTVFKTAASSIVVPPFIADDPLFLFSGSIDKINNIDTPPILSEFNYIFQIIQNLSGTSDNLNIVLQDGNLISFNEGRYDEIKSYIILQMKNKKDFINHLKSLQNSKIKQSILNRNPLFTITAMNNPQIKLPLYVVLKDQFAILSFNKKILTTLLTASKNSFHIKQDPSKEIEIYANIPSILMKFPILKSFSNQVAFNLDSIISITGYKTSLKDGIGTQLFTIKLK